jgi:hypothetical protein
LVAIIVGAACVGGKEVDLGTGSETEAHAGAEAQTQGTAGETWTGWETLTGGESQHIDLFACPFEGASWCPAFNSYTPDPAADECAARLVSAGEPGVLLATDEVFPIYHRVETLVILQGDGTAIVQKRSCEAERCHEEPWDGSIGGHQRCTVDPTGNPGVCCDAEDDCTPCVWWNPWEGLTDCARIDDLTCEQAGAAFRR